MKNKKQSWIIIGIIIAVIIIVNLLAFLPKQSDTIKIGFIGALSGDAGAYGETQLNSINLAVQEINKDSKRKIEIIAEDGKCMGNDAATSANKLVNIDEVKFILGFTCSSEMLSVTPITKEKKILLFSSFASNPQISDVEYAFRNVPTDSDWAPYASEIIYQDNYRKLAILSENTEFAVGARNIIKDKFIELGGDVVSDELYEQNSKDYRTQITKLKSSNPDVIFLLPQSDNSAGLAAKQIRELGITAPIYSTYVWTSQIAIDVAGDSSEGIYLFDAPTLGENEKSIEFLEKYNSKYGAPAHDFLAALSYDLPYILNLAFEECDDDPECVKDYLSTLKDYEGVVGTYGFNEKGDVIGINFVKKQVVNGKLEIV